MSDTSVEAAAMPAARVHAARSPETFDVAVVGGGMVGATLAVALQGLGLRIALIEAVPHDSAAQPSFDERTTALSNGSRRILETLGVWSAVSPMATPIAKIHVSDQGRFGFARIDAAEQGLSAMGFVVPNRALGAALWSRLAVSQDVRLFCPARVLRVTSGARDVELHLSAKGDGMTDGDVEVNMAVGAAAMTDRDVESNRATAAGAKIDGVAESDFPGGGADTTTLRAQLVVAADGANSAVRAAFGVAAEVRDYAQTAIITTVLTQRFHDHVAYERFTPSGPLALLPLSDGRCTLVLTLTPAMAEAALTWSDAEFLAEVQSRFGFRLGRFLKVGRRVSYPLSLTRSSATSRGRCVVIGNAAQGLHPVAGMGFNLGLRDVASLAELMADHRAARHGAVDAGATDRGDPGGTALLAEYDAWRSADRGGIIAFTDGLVRMFSSPLGAVQRLRNFGLLAFDILPPAKAALSRLSTGAAGRVPKLARGVALR